MQTRLPEIHGEPLPWLAGDARGRWRGPGFGALSGRGAMEGDGRVRAVRGPQLSGAVGGGARLYRVPRIWGVKNSIAYEMRVEGGLWNCGQSWKREEGRPQVFRFAVYVCQQWKRPNGLQYVPRMCACM